MSDEELKLECYRMTANLDAAKTLYAWVTERKGATPSPDDGGTISLDRSEFTGHRDPTEYEAGRKARRENIDFDHDKSLSWKDGWNDQEAVLVQACQAFEEQEATDYEAVRDRAGEVEIPEGFDAWTGTAEDGPIYDVGNFEKIEVLQRDGGRAEGQIDSFFWGKISIAPHKEIIAYRILSQPAQDAGGYAPVTETDGEGEALDARFDRALDGALTQVARNAILQDAFEAAGLIYWNGGDCPVAEAEFVNIVLRGGGGEGGPAGSMDWEHSIGQNHKNDLVAYQLQSVSREWYAQGARARRAGEMQAANPYLAPMVDCAHESAHYKWLQGWLAADEAALDAPSILTDPDLQAAAQRAQATLSAGTLNDPELDRELEAARKREGDQQPRHRFSIFGGGSKLVGAQ